MEDKSCVWISTTRNVIVKQETLRVQIAFESVPKTNQC